MIYIKIYLSIRKSSLDDPLDKVRDVEGIGHYAPGDSEVLVSNETDIPHALKLVTQAYKKN